MSSFSGSARLAAALLGLAFGWPAFGQVRAPQIESPVVHPDRTVTFSLRAPRARQVELSAQFLPANQPLAADTNGVWRVTVGPVAPDLYPYAFVVDGLSVADPANPDLFPNERFKSSLVEIPGDRPSLHTLQDVPHGSLTYGWYPSKKLGRTRPVIVYTPPGYPQGARKYPVLYLISGTTDTEETWFRAGRANVILDNLIAQRRAVPMVIVMPYGNMMMGTPPPTSPEAAVMYQVFSDELMGDLLPYVEAHYRVDRRREKRAIAGFSRGGGQALFAGFQHVDQFAWIGSYSAYLTPEVFERYFPRLAADPAAANRQFKLLWLGVGKTDFLHAQASAFDQYLTSKQIAHRSLVTEGGHTWMNARHYLAETLQLYFK